MKSSMTILSPAKINLGLDITERLPDGYHVVRMIMQSLDLCDEVHISLDSCRAESGASDRPVIRLVREGTQTGELQKQFSNSVPVSASESIWGVRIGPAALP